MLPLPDEIIAQAFYIAWAFFFTPCCVILCWGLAERAGRLVRHAVRLWTFRRKGLRTPERWKWKKMMRRFLLRL